jgi:hypothetical protein
MLEPPLTVSVETARDRASCWNPGYDKGALDLWLHQTVAFPDWRSAKAATPPPLAGDSTVRVARYSGRWPVVQENNHLPGQPSAPATVIFPVVATGVLPAYTDGDSCSHAVR